jgi:uncharacterized protein YbaR (Trm112 family)
MNIYVLRSGQKQGPYSCGQVRDQLASGHLQVDDPAWHEGLANWAPLGSVLRLEDSPPLALVGQTQYTEPAVESYPCPRCRGELRYQMESPSAAAGCIIILLGLLFAPLIIGIPIIIYGIVLMGKEKKYWHCRSCGTMFPV